MKEGLNIEHISKFYKGRALIRDISLTLKQGEIVGLFGPNGAGKTTCFSAIAGLLFPDHGKIYLDDKDITKLPMFMRARSKICYLPQETSIFKNLTVEENILLLLEIIEKSSELREKMLEQLLSEFSITHLRYTPASALSGGERRRVEIARIIGLYPKYILLDEPLAGIDPIAIHDLKLLIKSLKEKNIGILITDHNIKEMLEIVDRIYIIYDGKVLISGTPETIINNEMVREVYLGSNFNFNSSLSS